MRRTTADSGSGLDAAWRCNPPRRPAAGGEGDAGRPTARPGRANTAPTCPTEDAETPPETALRPAMCCVRSASGRTVTCSSSPPRGPPVPHSRFRRSRLPDPSESGNTSPPQIRCYQYSMPRNRPSGRAFNQRMSQESQHHRASAAQTQPDPEDRTTGFVWRLSLENSHRRLPSVWVGSVSVGDVSRTSTAGMRAANPLVFLRILRCERRFEGLESNL